MHKNQLSSLRRGAQAGFTLIELIVVIVILGILAATALPKFASLGGDARVAKLNAAAGSIRSAAAMYHGRWLARGATGAISAIETGVDLNATGYPTAATIATAAGLGSTEYTITGSSIKASGGSTTCTITYAEGTGTVTDATAGSCD